MALSETTSTWGVAASGTSARPPAPSDESPLRRGATLGRYVLLDLLGRGGMGAVYSAWDTQLERRVALKILRAGPSEALTERVFAEARALAQLRHPNVVGVHDVGEVRGMVFIAMELIEGETLRSWAQAHKDPAALVELLVQCARGLAAVHRAGLLHRDVKPGNIVVDSSAVRPKPVVVDFGLAIATPTPSTHPGQREEPSEPALPWAGTPAYMAPECFEDLGGPASDQWSFALACAELLEGERPSRAAAAQGRLTFGPAALREVIARGLGNEPASRWPNLDAMADAMEAALRRPRRWFGLAFIAAIGLGAAAYSTRADPCIAAAHDARSEAWNDQIASRARTRLETVDPGLAQRFVDEAEAWSVAWETSYAGACRTQRLGSAAGWCLQEGVATVALVTELAAQGEGPDAKLYAISGVLPRLPDPAACMGPETENRPQPTPDERTRFAAATAELDRAGVLEMIGHLDEAGTLAEQAWLATSEAPPLLRAPIAQRRSSIALRQGALGDSATRAIEALGLAAEAKDDWLVATVALDHAEILTVEGQVEALRAHLVHTDAAVKRAGGVPAQKARLHAARGRFYEIALDAENSLAEHVAALELRREFLPGSIYEADSLVNIAVAQGTLGHLDEAMAAIDDALARYRGLLGEVHPTVGHACIVRGITQQRRGAFAQALSTLESCIAILETTLGPNAKEIALAQTIVGTVLAGQGQYPAAREAFARVVEIRIAALGPDHPETGLAHANLGNILAALADPAARQHLERARVITVAVHGPQSPQLSSILTGLGTVAMGEGDLVAAREHLGRSLAIEEAAEGSENPALVVNLINLGEVQAKLAEPAARATYDRADRILSAMGTAHPFQSVIDVAIAELMLAAGDDDGARARLDQAIAAIADGEPVPGLQARARFARARLWYRDPQRRADAITEMQQARAALPVGVDAQLGAAIDAWLTAPGE